MEAIKVLFVTDNINKYNFDLPEWISPKKWNDKLVGSKEYFEIVILDRNVNEKEAATLGRITKAYCMFYLEGFAIDDLTWDLLGRKFAKKLSLEGVEDLLKNRGKDYFSFTYGEKSRPNHLGVAQSFEGSIKWYGQYSVSLEGDYGDKFNQIVFWKYNIPMEKFQSLDLWLEYKKCDDVEIMLEVRKIISGSLADISNVWTFSEENLKNEICIENDDVPGVIFISLKAKGQGELDIIALHDRISRRGLGTFMVGGERYVTSDREEIFAYFDPGDYKPPLAVYFSGYKTQEGFEGYHMMRKMGCPFLLIAEQRFEGGGFYMGDSVFEALMVKIIDSYLNKLGFYSDQLILSGISMGTIGSMYYGCDMKPHALILGKPLASLGDIAANERLKRPGGFATSLDLLQRHGGGMDSEAIDRLNDRFWDKIRHTDFSHTKFIVSYMYEDDYDDTAYDKLLSELNSFGVQVYGKGLHGRHNDNTAGIGAWFKGQYERVLKDDFNRV